MPVDAQSQAVLDEAVAKGHPPYHTLSPQELRSAFSFPPGPGMEVAKVEDRLIPGPAGDIPVRVYTPFGEGPFPALIWLHGGGWVIGDLAMGDGTSRRLATYVGCVVVSVDYRLAPENKFPAGVEDCYAATAWVAQNGEAIGVDGRRVAVGGVSAGGNLAAAVSLMARDRGGPPLALQLMVSATTSRSHDTKSWREKGQDYFPTSDLRNYFWNHYLRDEEDAKNPYAAPIQAKDLRGVAPALIIAAEYDPVSDDGANYAQRLKEAGVPATYTCYEGTIHQFFRMPDRIDQGKQAVAQAVEALKAAFA